MLFHFHHVRLPVNYPIISIHAIEAVYKWSIFVVHLDFKIYIYIYTYTCFLLLCSTPGMVMYWLVSCVHRLNSWYYWPTNATLLYLKIKSCSQFNHSKIIESENMYKNIHFYCDKCQDIFKGHNDSQYISQGPGFTMNKISTKILGWLIHVFNNVFQEWLNIIMNTTGPFFENIEARYYYYDEENVIDVTVAIGSTRAMYFWRERFLYNIFLVNLVGRGVIGFLIMVDGWVQFGCGVPLLVKPLFFPSFQLSHQPLFLFSLFIFMNNHVPVFNLMEAQLFLLLLCWWWTTVYIHIPI